MIVQNLNKERLSDIRNNPKATHWAQSRFERVRCAAVLLDGGSFLLTKTEFTAPKLVAHCSFRTEHVGETFRSVFAECNNLEMFSLLERSFHMRMEASYAPGEFPHVDYTLWVAEHNDRGFANMRTYPPGSYVMDIITAEIKTVRTGGSVCSYLGSAEEMDRLAPADRTDTLVQLAKQNRLSGGKLAVLTPQGQFEGDLGNSGLLVNYDDFSTMHLTDLNPNTLNRIDSANLSELELQRLFRRFILHLGQCGIDYRR